MSTDCEGKHRADAQFLHEIFGKRGPGLVSQFKIGREFLEDDPILEGPLDQDLYKEVVAGLEDRKEHNLHAMVMIGAYRDADEDRYWFVLQNTHKNAYFKLVDSVHLASCGATVYFPNPKTDMSLKGDIIVTEGDGGGICGDLDRCGGVHF